MFFTHQDNPCYTQKRKEVNQPNIITVKKPSQENIGLLLYIDNLINKKKDADSITYTQAEVSCFVRQESSKFVV